MGCIGSRTITAEAVPVRKDGEQQGGAEVSWEGINPSTEDTTSILPRIKQKANPYGIGALAKSSLTGVSGVSRTMKDKVTKPTAMAQGRVAHMIEWQSWGKPSAGPEGGVGRNNLHRERERRIENDIYSDLSDGEKEARFAAGVMQQFAISEATLIGWTSMEEDGLCAGSNQGSVAHLSEVNQESITSRDQAMHHSTAEVWPHTYVSQGLYCLSSSEAWEPISNEPSAVASPAAGSYVLASGTSGEGFEGNNTHFLSQQPHLTLQQQSHLQQLHQIHQYQQQQFLQYQQQQALEHRFHSNPHSLQATPNSTIHSMGPLTHPRLADLWASALVEPQQVDIAGQMTLMDGGMAEMMGDGFDAESKIIAEQQEEEAKEDEVTLTLEPESGTPPPTTTQPSPWETCSPSVDGPSPGPPPFAAVEPAAEHAPFEVTFCVVQSLEEKDEEAVKEKGSVVVVATN